MEIKKHGGFTLVELIVVITILAILGTIAFLSLTKHATYARNSVRAADMKSIDSAVSFYFVKAGRLPYPTDPFSVSYSGSVVWNQGVFGPRTLMQAKAISKIPVDPLTGEQYTYSVTGDYFEYQIAGVMENLFAQQTSLVPQAQAAPLIKQGHVSMTGNYNGFLVRVRTGTGILIMSAPSIISTDSTDFDFISVLNNKRFSYNNSEAIPANYQRYNYQNTEFDFSPATFEIYSGSVDDFYDQAYRMNLLVNLQTAYSGAHIDTQDGVEQLLSIHADINNPSNAAKYAACDIVRNKLFILSVNCEALSMGVHGSTPSSSSSTSSSSTSSTSSSSSSTSSSSTSSSSTSSSSTSSSSSSSSGGGNNYASLPDDGFTNGFVDSSGGVWIGTDDGVGYFDASGNYTLFDEDSGVIEEDIFSITEDLSGNIWVGTDGGVSKYNPTTETWTSYTKSSTSNGLVSDHVESINVDTSGDLWFATDKGISMFNGTSWTPYTTSNSSLSHKNTYSSMEDNLGNIWIATHLGANRFTPPSTWVIYKKPAYSSFTNNQTNVVFEDSDGIIWIGTDAELIKRDQTLNTWTRYTTTQGLVDNSVKIIMEDTAGKLWIGTEEGVSMFNGSTFTNYSEDLENLEYDNVSDLFQDPDSGDIYVLTDDGMGIISN